MMRKYAAELERLVCEHTSASEGLLTEYDLYEYASATVLHLEQNGYDVDSDIEIGGLLEALDSILADNTVDESLKSWARRARSAIGGAVANVLPKAVHAKIAKYHDKKLSQAVDSGDDRAVAKHYMAKAQAIKRADPKKWNFTSSQRETDPEHHNAIKTAGTYGGSADTRRVIRSVRAARDDRAEKKHADVLKSLKKDSDIQAKEPTHPGVPHFGDTNAGTNPGGKPKPKVILKPAAREPTNPGVRAAGGDKTNPGPGRIRKN